MRINVTELAEGPLAHLSPAVRCARDAVLYCSNIRFWDGVYDSDCLYIGRASALPPQVPGLSGRHQLQLLLIEDAPIPAAYLEHPSARIISFPPETDPFRLFNAISDSGFCLPRYAMKLTELLESIPENDFPSIAQRVGNVLGRPVSLLTPALRLLARSGEETSGKPSSRRMEQLRDAGLAGHLSPVMLRPGERRIWPLKEYPGESGELFSPIVHEGELRDVLGYIYCRDIPKADAVANLPALRYISRLLASRFLRFIREGRGDDASFSLLMGKIISGELKDDALIESFLRQTAFAIPKNMVLITVLADTLSTDAIAECADTLCRSVWPQTRAALVSNQIILLIGSDELPVVKPDELLRFEQYLGEYQCTAGISEPFHTFDHYLRNHFHRTFCAAVVASLRGDRRYGTYGESALYHLASDISNVASLSPFKDAFVDANLMRLIEYDASHGTDYLTTLRYYWHYNRSSAALCRLLHIQRSTLFYRLTKIREILEQDFNDYTSLIQLSVGIAILEARGIVPAFPLPEAPPAPGKSGRDGQ